MDTYLEQTICRTIPPDDDIICEVEKNLFTYGEIFIALLLFMIFLAFSTSKIIDFILRRSSTKKYVGNNSQDGKMLYDN